MIIKSFKADTASAAMKVVRSEMGGDAIVLKTRQFRSNDGRRQVEITACIERTSVAQASTILAEPRTTAEGSRLKPDVLTTTSAPEGKKALPGNAQSTPIDATMELAHAQVDNSRFTERLDRIDEKVDRLVRLSLQKNIGSSMADEFHPIVKTLQDADVPDDFIHELCSTQLPGGDESQSIQEQIRQQLVAELSRMMAPDLTITSGDRVLFLGLPGSGKSSLMGKLTADLSGRQKQKVTLTSLDYQKIGAHEELATYADLLAVDLALGVTDKNNDSVTDKAILLIDSPGLPVDLEQQERFRTMVQQSDATHRVAVFSALMRSADIEEIAAQFRMLAPTHFAITMFDLTHRYGAVVAVARALRVPVVFLTDAPGGMGTLNSPDPDRLARLLLNQEVSNATN